MSKNKKPFRRSVDSNFDRKESFTIHNVPQHFDSVTMDSLKNIKRNAIESAERNSNNFKPGALEAMLKGVDGQFEEAYSTLEGDYGTRLQNLKNVYTKGLTEVRKAFNQYKLQVAKHNIAFDNYSDANQAINGEKLPENLKISDDEINELNILIKKLDGSNYE